MRISDQALNRLKVLKALRQNRLISRTDLPALTGLAAATITHVTSELIERGFVLERKDPQRQRGRPRVFLEIDAGGAIVLGASLDGGNLMSVIFADLTGRTQFACTVELVQPKSLTHLAECIALGVQQAIAQSPFALGQIHRAGIGLPAVVDTVRGIVHYMITMPEETFPFADAIAARLGMPVTIENDLLCKARAEHWFGRARTLDTFTLIELGIAVGAAVYGDGLPKSGDNGFGPEIGHIKTDPAPEARACICGARGCLMAYASAFGMLHQLETFPEVAIPTLDELDARFAAFLDRAETGDEAVLALLHAAGHHLGLAIANLIHLNDPGHILLLATHPRQLRLIRAGLEATIAANVLPGFRTATRLIYGDADDDWRSKGAAALALEQTFLSLN
jgi:predicted NBD/HSP70 family sugar kinase